MASKGKKNTTMAKLARESRLRERQMDKKAKKDARKNAPPYDPYAVLEDPDDVADEGETAEAAVTAASQTVPEA